MSNITLQDAGHSHEVAPRMPMGKLCLVHKHEHWVPIEEHHVWPKGMGGPDAASNKISVCCNGHYEIHEFIRQLILHAGSVPWTLAQHFGPKVRDYARIGWEKAGSPTSGTVKE